MFQLKKLQNGTEVLISAHGPYTSWGGRRFEQVESQRDRFCQTAIHKAIL